MSVHVLHGDCRDVLLTLPDESVNCIVTSPPYFGLRDYGVAGQIGLEATPDAYVAELVGVFRECRRVLRNDGTLFLNLGDSYWGGGRGGGGSFASERRGWNAIPCGISGKEPGGSPERDCLCENLCDACRAAYRIGKSHSDTQLAPKLDASSRASSREHKGLSRGHLPTLGLKRQADRNEDATLCLAPSPRRGDVQPPVVLASKSDGCVLPLQGSNSAASIPVVECQLCGATLPDCVRASAHKAACTCDTSGDGSEDRKIGRGVSGSAYPDFTTASLKPKDLIGIPWMVAFALRADGWYLRSDIIWSKPNPMPESVRDRPTKAHEYLFLLSKSGAYYYDAEAVAESIARPWGPENGIIGRKGLSVAAGGQKNPTPGRCEDSRNRRSVWTVATQPFSEAHFATFPPDLIEPCIKAGCPAQVCSACGAPWGRETERKVAFTSGSGKSGLVPQGKYAGTEQAVSGSYDIRMGPSVTTTTIGFRPTCECEAASVPGTVLDPFSGAGTTGLVADRLQRNAILIELNPDYAAMAERRIAGDRGGLLDAMEARP